MEKPDNEIVILLHGIGHAAPNMMLMENALKREWYKTLNLTYPSLKKTIHENSQWLHTKLKLKDAWQQYSKIHFVCHSMGGLVTDQYLQEFKDEIPADKMGRVVMLGTPHGGSEVADLLKDFAPYQWIFGPAGQELTTASRRANQVAPWYDLGIIAGTENWFYPLGKYSIKTDNDGCVSVDSTKLPGMKDHIVMQVSHGFMGWTPEVHKQAVHFLKYGEFNHG